MNLPESAFSDAQSPPSAAGDHGKACLLWGKLLPEFESSLEVAGMGAGTGSSLSL